MKSIAIAATLLLATAFVTTASAIPPIYADVNGHGPYGEPCAGVYYFSDHVVVCAGKGGTSGSDCSLYVDAGEATCFAISPP